MKRQDSPVQVFGQTGFAMGLKRLLALSLVALLPTSSLFAETFEYDELGRLTRVIYDDETQVDYNYDPAGNRTTKTVSGVGVNQAPLANDDRVKVNQNEPLHIDPTLNDSDPNGDPLGIDSTSVASNGTIEQLGGRLLKYTPSLDYVGPDSITYTIKDHRGETSSATVYFNVTANLPPMVVADALQAPHNTTSTVSVLANDGDPNGDVIQLDSITQPTNGTAQITSPGVVEYTPNTDYIGADQFTYTASDPGGLTSTQTVSVDVYDSLYVVLTSSEAAVAPFTKQYYVTNETLWKTTVTYWHRKIRDSSGTVIYYNMVSTLTTPTDTGSFCVPASLEVSGYQFSGNGCELLKIDQAGPPDNHNPLAVNDAHTMDENQSATISVVSNDSDDDNDPLSVTFVANGTFGTVSIDANGTDLTYTPASAFFGTDSFEYTVGDGNGGSSSAAVQVIVESVINVVPVAVNDNYNGNDGQTLTLDPLSNDSDGNDDPLSIASVSGAANGTATIISSNTEIEYASNVGFVGTETLSYTVSDGNGGQSSATITIDVEETNIPPVAVADALSTNEDTVLTANPTLNDTDGNGDALVITAITAPTDGAAVILGNQIEIEYTPNSGFVGSDSFDYTVSDPRGGTSTATITVDVLELNVDPVAVNDSATTDEDVAVTISPLTNDTDANNHSLTVTLVSTPINGTSSILTGGTQVEYTPNTGFIGVDTFNYSISDGNGGSATAAIAVDVQEINLSPVAQDDTGATDEDVAFTVDPRSNDSDPNGDALTIASATNGTNGSVVVAGDGLSLTYTPDADYSGSDSFTYTIDDGRGETDTATFSMTVNSVNDDPIAVADTESLTTNTTVTISVLGNDTDVESDPLTITSVTSPSQGTVQIVNSSTQVEYTSTGSYVGSDSFDYTLSDGQGGASTATVTLNVTSAGVIVQSAAGDVVAPYIHYHYYNPGDAKIPPFHVYSVQLPIPGQTAETVYTSGTGYCDTVNGSFPVVGYQFSGNGCEITYTSQ